ncbi:DUF418 domain-containing protein [Sphingomicrobium astaxanthinifaciens]|uniref:DUF418 domain-containing protein n=1 Tax=Sphingomicrobium astaxanthinifaciens TaxID=1227949 RepID=UPI001FCC34C0|nr:DUF418 domain-containing protein [Sphingomicrobium astaxanthinifaciens]MCJ7421622.1 DUF418 domain-containing protein [Sphingomicrobium astaxanthinifaciens]
MATTQPSRIAELDAARGLAVIGILFANVIDMGLPGAAVSYPTFLGFDGAGDRLAHGANFLFIDGRMRSLFSLLFGASLLLVCARAEAAGRAPLAAHAARMGTLLLFGLAHFYFLWQGDILAHYALVGMVAFWFREAPARWLLLAAIGLLALNFLFLAALTGTALAAPGPLALAPTTLAPAELAREIAAHDNPLAHAAATLAHERWTWLTNTGWFFVETLGLMLLGMALLANGFLAGAHPPRRYARVALLVPLGAAAALPVLLLVVQRGYRPDDLLLVRVFALLPLQPVMAVGYAACAILLARRGGALAARLGAAGRAAFTNYLGATVLMAPLVFGGGFAQLSRGQWWLCAPLGALVMLGWSKPWLERFRYGPFEWLWRSLARGRWAPLRR